MQIAAGGIHTQLLRRTAGNGNIRRNRLHRQFRKRQRPRHLNGQVLFHGIQPSGAGLGKVNFQCVSVQQPVKLLGCLQLCRGRLLQQHRLSVIGNDLHAAGHPVHFDLANVLHLGGACGVALVIIIVDHAGEIRQTKVYSPQKGWLEQQHDQKCQHHRAHGRPDNNAYLGTFHSSSSSSSSLSPLWKMTAWSMLLAATPSRNTSQVTSQRMVAKLRIK